MTTLCTTGAALKFALRCGKGHGVSPQMARAGVGCPIGAASAAALLACSLAACPAVRQGHVAGTRSRILFLAVVENCVLSQFQLPPIIGEVTDMLLDESRGVLAIKRETSRRHGFHGCHVQDVLEK